MSIQTFLLYILGLFFVAIICVSHAFAACTDDKYLVTRIIDGDTIEVDHKHKIRILGIDTYDKNSRMAKKQSLRTGYSVIKVKYLAQQATKAANNLLFGECVKLVKDKKDKGRYGRYLRYVEVNGRDYQKIMLNLGHANVYCGDKKIKRFKQYHNASKFKC
jgi:endonuclease YncB( thermonuclease family)